MVFNKIIPIMTTSKVAHSAAARILFLMGLKKGNLLNKLSQFVFTCWKNFINVFAKLSRFLASPR